jgi:hypothetical protein
MTKWSAAPNRQNEATLSAGQPGGATGGRIPGRVQCVRPPGDPPGAVCASGRPVSTFLPPAVGDWEPSRSQAAPASVGAIDPARTPHADALRRYVTAPTMERIPFPATPPAEAERPQHRTPGLGGGSRGARAVLTVSVGLCVRLRRSPGRAIHPGRTLSPQRKWPGRCLHTPGPGRHPGRCRHGKR